MFITNGVVVSNMLYFQEYHIQKFFFAVKKKVEKCKYFSKILSQLILDLRIVDERLRLTNDALNSQPTYRVVPKHQLKFSFFVL